jgi:hypothetical protein
MSRQGGTQLLWIHPDHVIAADNCNPQLQFPPRAIV